MKKILALVLAALMLLACVACGTTTDDTTADNTVTDAPETNAPSLGGDTDGDLIGVMTYAEYDAAAIDAPVYIEAYIQAAQKYSAEYGNTTLYLQDKDGAYFVYRCACTADEYAAFTVGTKVKVIGYKAAWSGEVEIVDASVEVIEGADTYIAEAFDATALLGTDELIKHQNKFVTFKGLTLKEVSYKNNEPGDDIYVTVTKDGADYSFCVEVDLVNAEAETYKAFAELKAGDVIDVDGFLYWYEGVNTHITAVKIAE